MVEEWMVDEGFVSVEIPEIPLDPNAYLLVVELYSNGLESDIILLDDTTVPQPYFASMYWSTEDETWYSNGNAMAIHMGLNGLNYADVNEEIILSGIEIFPNPTNSLISISSSEMLKGETTISLYNIIGENVKTWNFNNFGLTNSINIENLASGNYIIKVSNNDRTIHEKIVKE